MSDFPISFLGNNVRGRLTCNFLLMRTSFLLISPFLNTMLPSIRHFSTALCAPDSPQLPPCVLAPLTPSPEYTRFAHVKIRLPATTAPSSLILCLSFQCWHLPKNNFTTPFPWFILQSKSIFTKIHPSIKPRFISILIWQVVLVSSLQKLSALRFHSTTFIWVFYLDATWGFSCSYKHWDFIGSLH